MRKARVESKAIQAGINSMEFVTKAALPADTVEMARFLIGTHLFRRTKLGLMAGRIVETEAYLTGDAASHAFRGPTKRNAPMYLARGHAYVYLAYGTSLMLNISSGAEGQGEAVLIRALEPVEGIALMQAARGRLDVRDLASGPGKLAQALEIGLGLNGHDCCAGESLWLGPPDAPAAIGVSKRIGITKDADRPLRFYEKGNRFVSGPRSLNNG